jgi:hypothetical protein
MAGKRWGLIVLGVVIFVIVVGGGMIGTAVYLLSRQFEVHSVPASSPEPEFDKVLAQFEGQKPYIEIPSPSADTPPTVHHEQEKAQAQPLNTIHLLVWDPGERKVVRVNFPFWIVRLRGDRPLNLSSSQSGLRSGVRLQVTPEQIERHGPGLIVDLTGRVGERVLVWVD